MKEIKIVLDKSEEFYTEMRDEAFTVYVDGEPLKMSKAS